MSFLTRREAKKAEEKDLQMSPQGTAKKRASATGTGEAIEMKDESAAASTLSPQMSAKHVSGNTGGLKPLTSGLRPLGPPGPRTAPQATSSAFHAQKTAEDAKMKARGITSQDPSIGGVTAGERIRKLAEINYDHQSRIVAKEAMSDHIDLSGITDDGMTMDEYEIRHQMYNQGAPKAGDTLHPTSNWAAGARTGGMPRPNSTLQNDLHHHTKDLEDRQFWDTDNAGVVDSNKYDSAGDIVEEPDRKQTLFGNLFSSSSRKPKRVEKVHYGTDYADDGLDEEDNQDPAEGTATTRSSPALSSGGRGERAESTAAYNEYTPPVSKRSPQSHVFVTTDVKLKLAQSTDMNTVGSVLGAMRALVEGTCDEAGCISFNIVKKTSGDSETFSMIGQWNSPKAYAIHKTKGFVTNANALLTSLNAHVTEEVCQPVRLDTLLQQFVQRDVLVTVRNPVGVVVANVGPISSSADVAELKQLIAKDVGIAATQQRLVSDGVPGKIATELADGTLLGAYELPKDPKVPLQLRVKIKTAGSDYTDAFEIEGVAYSDEALDTIDDFSSRHYQGKAVAAGPAKSAPKPGAISGPSRMKTLEATAASGVGTVTEERPLMLIIRNAVGIKVGSIEVNTETTILEVKEMVQKVANVEAFTINNFPCHEHQMMQKMSVFAGKRDKEATLRIQLKKQDYSEDKYSTVMLGGTAEEEDVTNKDEVSGRHDMYHKLDEVAPGASLRDMAIQDSKAGGGIKISRTRDEKYTRDIEEPDEGPMPVAASIPENLTATRRASMTPANVRPGARASISGPAGLGAFAAEEAYNPLQQAAEEKSAAEPPRVQPPAPPADDGPSRD